MSIDNSRAGAFRCLGRVTPAHTFRWEACVKEGDALARVCAGASIELGHSTDEEETVSQEV